MNPIFTFFFGLLILGMFGWYFFTEIERRKRIVGTALTILLVAFCIESVYPPKDKVQLGLDLEGGSSFLIRLVKENPEDIITPTMQTQAVEVIRKRVDAFGVSEPLITPQGEDRILVQIPGLDAEKIQNTREQLQRVAKLEFRLVHPESDSIISRVESGTGYIPAGWQRIDNKEVRNGQEFVEPLIIKSTIDIPGNLVRSAYSFYGNEGYGVALQFNSEGAELFGQLTAENVGRRFAIILDGEVQSAPSIREAIYGGSATITGRFSAEEAQNLSSVLENPLESPVVIEEERSVSATLGTEAIRRGVLSILSGFGVVILCTLLYYRFAGIVAIIGLFVNLVLLFGLMSMFNFVLTLPGIAGIVLTIGMAIDANVLIYERIREELRAGKSLPAAVRAGYDKAFSAIFDSNITTLFTSAILFWKGTGSIKGFAITLTVGITASMFSALLVTRNCFNWMLYFGWLKRLTMLNLIKSTNIDFLGKRKLTLTLGAVLCILSISLVAFKGKDNLGIDFTGGDLISFHFEEQTAEKIEDSTILNALNELGINDLALSREKAATAEILSIRAPHGTASSIEKQLKTTFPEAGFTVDGIETIGAVVGGELARTSLWALFLGALAIFIYLAARFEFSFGIGAIVALLHDLTIVIGCLSLFGFEFSLITVGAILTVAGYSINDTIIIFDRIREELQINGTRKATLNVMNEAINHTLSRTIMTSSFTLFSLIALYFFGGPVLQGFAFAIIMGILIGTLSSIYIATPVTLLWTKWRRKDLAVEIQESKDLLKEKTA